MKSARKHFTQPAATILVLTGLMFAPFAMAQTPAPKAPPARVRAKLDGFDLSSKSGKSANQIGGASRDLGTPRLYAPGVGKAYSLTPTFYWATPDDSHRVTFRLTTINGVKMYETTTTESHLTYPGDAPALTPGQYRWTVVPENDMLGGAPTPATLVIVGKGERDAIAQELASAPDSANVFVSHRIWYDAIAAYSAMLDKDSADQMSLKGRAALYDQLQVTQPLADADLKLVH
jgi:hypothetical protein